MQLERPTHSLEVKSEIFLKEIGPKDVKLCTRVFALLGCYTAQIGSYLLFVPGQTIGPIFKGQAVREVLDCLNFENGIDRFFLNIGDQIPTYAHIQWGNNLKSFMDAACSSWGSEMNYCERCKAFEVLQKGNSLLAKKVLAL
jgi:hypothetical protein